MIKIVKDSETTIRKSDSEIQQIQFEKKEDLEKFLLDF